MIHLQDNNMLYHYTSLETLYKIFHNTKNGYITLRANYFMNMNDPLDCRYFIKEVLTSAMRHPARAPVSQFWYFRMC